MWGLGDMTAIGSRDRLIVIERAGLPVEDGYTTNPGEFAEFTRAWAKVLFGTGQERREAAQERASVSATFNVRWTPKLAQVGPADRINWQGIWDIASAIPVGRNREIHFTATRKA